MAPEAPGTIQEVPASMIIMGANHRVFTVMEPSIFGRLYRLMVCGSFFLSLVAMSGYRMFPVAGVRILLVRGHLLFMAGHGFLTNPGDGYRIITGTGFFIRCIDGYGCPVIHGLRHALFGVILTDIMDGRRYLHVTRPFSVITEAIHVIAATIGIPGLIHHTAGIQDGIPVAIRAVVPAVSIQGMNTMNGFRMTPG